MNNPFKYSDDNKRYLTFNYYGKHKYGNKICKVPIDAGFSCPNRDGNLSYQGCIYCSGGANAFPNISQSNLLEQYYQRKEIYDHKWPNAIPFAYFQSYSNTYCSLSQMQEIYQPFIDNDDIKGIVVSTRSDCLDQEKIKYLGSLTKQKEIWLELGLQSSKSQTLIEMNRHTTFEQFLKILELLKNTNLMVSVHLINGWPSETEDDMLQSVKDIAHLPINAIKFHMLHICKGTPLARQYEKQPFKLLSKEDYIHIVAKQISYLRDDIIIERLTGDGLKSELIEPQWTLKKVSVINDIDKELVKLDLWQGKNYEKNQ